MMDFVAAFQHWLTLACFVALAVCLFALAVLCVIPELTDAIRRFCGMDNFSKVVCGVCIVGAVLYGGSKGVNVRWDDGLRDNGTLITNDTVAVRWTYSGIPSASSVFIDYREAGSTNKWLNLAETLASAQEWTGTLANATNYEYWVYSTYVPPVPVHTNGVWVGQAYETKARVGAKSFLILNGKVQEHGRTIATPAAKRRDAVPTARDYIQDGLIAMWDGIENAGWGTHDPNATVWKDLIGNCDADTDPNLVYDNYMQEDGSNNMKALTSADKIDFSRLTSVTFEACFLNEKNKANYHMAIGASPDYFSIGYPTSGSKTLSWKLGTGGRPTVTGVHGTLAAVYDNGSAGMYFNGSAGQFTTSNRNWNNTLYLMWANPWGAARGEKRCYCFRLYSRALSAEEIQHNYKIDKERFNLP